MQGVWRGSICQHGRQRSQCKECGGAASVSTGGGAVSARSVEGQASVSTGGGAVGAMSVVVITPKSIHLSSMQQVRGLALERKASRQSHEANES